MVLLRRRRQAEQPEGAPEEVRGPNSALTSFLREQGINASDIRQRYLRRQAQEEAEEVDEEEEEEETEEGRIRARAREKRRLDDDEDDDDSGEEADRDQGIRACTHCGVEFKVTVYSVSLTGGGILCKACGDEYLAVQRRQKQEAQRGAKKQRKKVAAALLDRQQIGRTAKLQDLCIRVLSKYIDQVDALGEIGANNMDKIGRILTRNRQLNDATVKLFLSSELTSLEFWDCSKLTPQAYDWIVAFCPHLTHLTLSMCGQLTNETLIALAKKLGGLKSLHLDGPFLISKDTWMEVFDLIGDRLEALVITNTHRINTEVILALVEKCPNIRRLGLHRLSGLDDPSAIDALSVLSNLTHLELTYLGDTEEAADELVTDDIVLNILGVCGDTLEELRLDGCTGLSDKFLMGLLQSSNLRSLSLELLDQLTDDGMAEFFSNFTANAGLNSLSLRKCVGLGDNAISAALSHSAATLVTLNLNSLQLVTSTSLKLIANAHHLTTLDVGFCRPVDNALIEKICANCKHISLITVFGVPKVNEYCRVPRHVRLIGRQGDIG
ncbi:DNA repair protein Rad7p [Trichomonascus vanleenenianus]|uniref:UV-damaged DNA-binding protein RAD7 n=1 Tax=Trichomonascus vanleenenianus TaxID=2268995 RepID=UPI003ECA321F